MIGVVTYTGESLYCHLSSEVKDRSGQSGDGGDGDGGEGDAV